MCVITVSSLKRVIRWLKCADADGLQLGVQMLSPGAVAVAALKDRSGKQDGEYTRGLLLPEIASIQQRSTMLLPSPPFRVGDTVKVNFQGKNIRVKLTKLLENTGSFAQFQFSSLGEVAETRAAKPKAGLKPNDFDDVWELL